jgi:hypothetical protein
MIGAADRASQAGHHRLGGLIAPPIFLQRAQDDLPDGERQFGVEFTRRRGGSVMCFTTTAMPLSASKGTRL